MPGRRARISRNAALTTKIWCTRPGTAKDKKNTLIGHSIGSEGRKILGLDHQLNAGVDEINLPAVQGQQTTNTSNELSPHRQNPAGMDQDGDILADEPQEASSRQDVTPSSPSTPYLGSNPADELPSSMSMDWESEHAYNTSPIGRRAVLEPNSFMRTIIEHEATLRTTPATPTRRQQSQETTPTGADYLRTPVSTTPVISHGLTLIENDEIMSDGEIRTPSAPVEGSREQLRDSDSTLCDEDQENHAPSSLFSTLQQGHRKDWTDSPSEDDLDSSPAPITSFEERLRDAGIAIANRARRTSSSSSSPPPIRSFWQRLQDAGISASNPRGHSSFLLQEKPHQVRQGYQETDKTSSTRTPTEQLIQTSAYPARKRNQRRGVSVADQSSPLVIANESGAKPSSDVGDAAGKGALCV